MKPNHQEILHNTFYQLLVVYTGIVFFIALGLLTRFALHFELLGVIIGILGIYTLTNKNQTKTLHLNKKMHYTLLICAILFIIVVRLIPYAHNTIPLGYDPGLYKYGIEHGLENKDQWIVRGGMEPGFLYIMEIFKPFFTTQFILTYILIVWCVLLGLSIYAVTKAYVNKQTALLSVILYAVSIIQFKTYWYLYYKNIIGITLALTSLAFFKYEQQNKWSRLLFILTGVLTGLVHRPTLYIYGLSLAAYCIISPYKQKTYQIKQFTHHLINGIIIITLILLGYYGSFRQALLIMVNPVLEGFVQTGESPGTFITFVDYQFAILILIPFAIIGAHALYKTKQTNVLFYWALISFCIVAFQFFFFNRFIIFLDIGLIFLASVGSTRLIETTKKTGILIVMCMLLSGMILVASESTTARPLLSNGEFETIQYMQTLPQDAYVMSTQKDYSPWLQGYSGHKTIAPGMFDYNKHTKDEWTIFWTTTDINQINIFLEVYPEPLYIFIGEKQYDNLIQFPECFTLYYELNNNRIYEYIC